MQQSWKKSNIKSHKSLLYIYLNFKQSVFSITLWLSWSEAPRPATTNLTMTRNTWLLDLAPRTTFSFPSLTSKSSCIQDSKMLCNCTKILCNCANLFVKHYFYCYVFFPQGKIWSDKCWKARTDSGSGFCSQRQSLWAQ